MNLFEYENQVFGGLWDKSSIEKCRKSRPKKTYPIVFPNVDRSDENWYDQPDKYYCWYGTRIPCWFE